MDYIITALLRLVTKLLYFKSLIKICDSMKLIPLFIPLTEILYSLLTRGRTCRAVTHPHSDSLCTLIHHTYDTVYGTVLVVGASGIEPLFQQPEVNGLSAPSSSPWITHKAVHTLGSFTSTWWSVFSLLLCERHENQSAAVPNRWSQVCTFRADICWNMATRLLIWNRLIPKTHKVHTDAFRIALCL